MSSAMKNAKFGSKGAEMAPRQIGRTAAFNEGKKAGLLRAAEMADARTREIHRAGTHERGPDQAIWELIALVAALRTEAGEG